MSEQVFSIGSGERSMDWLTGKGTHCGSTERVRKLNDLLGQAKACVDLTRARCITDVYKNHADLSDLEKKALATYNTIVAYEPRVEEGELIVGYAANKPKAHPLHPELETTWIEEEGGLGALKDRAYNPFYVSEEDIREFEEEIAPFWRDKTLFAKWRHICPPEIQKRTSGVGFAEATFDLCVLGSHESMDWVEIFKYGLDWYRKEAQKKLDELDVFDPNNYDKIQFYKGFILEVDAVEIFANKYADKCQELADAETDPKRKAELQRTADACRQVPMHPVRTFFEGCQCYWLIYCILPQDSSGPLFTIGRFDQNLWEFYKKDVIEDKILTRAEAQEIIECLWLKFNNTMFFTAIETAKIFAGTAVYQNLQVGGMDRWGNDATNELSYVAIDAMIEVRTIQPSFSVRLHEGSPEKFRMKIMDLVAAGMGHPSIYNDHIAIKTMLMTGHDWHEANDYCCGGCMEIGKQGHYFWGPGTYINMAMAVELAFTQGVKRMPGPMCGEQLSVRTKDPREMTNFYEFFDAVAQHITIQQDYLYASIGAMLETYQDYPLIMQSVLGGKGLERGLPFFGGGLDFSSFPGTGGNGTADVGDSLAAVKKLVFDDKVVSMDTMCKALEANFVGYEDVRQLCLNAPKYGNDDDYVDNLTKQIHDVMATYAKTKPGLLAKYDPDKATAEVRHQVGCVLAPVSGSIPQGAAVGALPSGRLAGEPLGDSVSAYPGMDKNGPTASLKSSAKLGHDRFHGTICNIYMNKSAFATPEGRHNCSEMVRTYFEQGGAQLQFNLQDKKTLEDAQQHPDKYPSLMVRVSGYSAYFVELDTPVQNQIMSRTRHAL